MEKRRSIVLVACGALLGGGLVYSALWLKPSLLLGQAEPRKITQREADFPFPTDDPTLMLQNLLLEEDLPMMGLKDPLEMKRREDEKFVYYDLKFAGLEGSKLEASVNDGQVTVQGEFNESSGGRVSSSNFQRSFPLPPNVDGAKMEVLPEPGKMVLKFPKH